MNGADRVIRRGLLATLLLGICGTLVELLLLKHTDGLWQLAPLALLGVALAVLVAHQLLARAATIRALQGVMILFLASGVVGLALHYRGNVEWELERMASLSGVELFRHAVMGATPTLAPGAMVILGLIGLLYTYRHPATSRAAPNDSETSS